MITSTSYYIGNIEIPNVATSAVPNANKVGKNTKLNLFISQYEADVSSKIFGSALDAEFQTHLEVKENATLQTVKDASDQKWKDLFSGKTYTKDNQVLRYRGLIFTEGTTPRSLFSEYIFKQFFQDDMTQYGGIGLQIEEAKNAKRASYTPKAVQAYNRFYELTVGNIDNPKQTSGFRSLYQFIRDMNELDDTIYTNWMPYCFPKLNIMGI